MDYVKDFAFGANSEQYTVEQVNADPQHIFAQAWIGVKLMFWRENSDKPVYAVIDSIVDTPLLGFTVMVDGDGILTNTKGQQKIHSAFEVAQLAMCYRIDNGNTFDKNDASLDNVTARDEAKRSTHPPSTGPTRTPASGRANATSPTRKRSQHSTTHRPRFTRSRWRHSLQVTP
jgi:hypothetical protein